MVYGDINCLPCVMAIEYLNRLGCIVDFRDITSAPNEIVSKCGLKSPIIIIDNHVICGFRVKEILEAVKDVVDIHTS